MSPTYLALGGQSIKPYNNNILQGGNSFFTHKTYILSWETTILETLNAR